MNDALKELVFEELEHASGGGGGGGFLPAVKQIANVAALPGIVQVWWSVWHSVSAVLWSRVVVRIAELYWLARLAFRLRLRDRQHRRVYVCLSSTWLRRSVTSCPL